MGKSERINGFDALRTIAMWLGVVLHAIIAYRAEPEVGWPHDNTVNSSFFDWLYMYIHIFRMPLFFLVGGFFSRMVILRSGMRYFLIQRYKRIFIPFVVGILIIVPPTMFPFEFYRFHDLQHLTVHEAFRRSLLQLLNWNGLAHLWFLYYLVLLYGLTVFVFYSACKIWPTRKNVITISSIGLPGISIAVIVLFSLLLYFGSFVPPVYTGLRPKMFLFLYYGFFYFCGWLIQTDMKCILSLKKFGWGLLLTGSVLSIVLTLKEEALPPYISLLLRSVETIALVGGLIGLFLKYFHEESRIWRYCSDAAYWVYLFHMGIVAGLQEFLMHSSVVGWLRLPVVLAVSFLLSVLSYEYLVRYTVIGVFLHGKRVREARNMPS